MANQLIDMTGERYGKLVVIGRNPINNKQNKPLWLCQCDCGSITTVTRRRLINGMTKSCGCYRKEQAKEQHTTHGMKHTRLYRIWAGMKDRCLNPNSKYWDKYGGRGISVCNDWSNDFVKFHDWALANGYQEDLTLDRVDNDKGYSPGNCRWTTYLVQENNRGNNIRYIVNGESVTITDLCRREGLTRWEIAKRYKGDLANGK